ncbi:DUF934 domain-containing protein [Loktanella sp. SALINAS62]|uniref:DUF934 domain-containing protein n=1 Tax=Loktanella sp. SALINAS62 TaxID=2706124 RepID=UPI001B8B2D92|nr:DUF934 domain-containing protein [Loktanella sp. SALINAS62]MBS1301577.1 DUF934 domain-containing protein [Loktanella sp. SALINAS62]
MSVIVTDTGFGTDDFDGTFVPLGEDGPAIDVPSDADPDAMRALTNAQAVRIAFPSFSDGRGFTLAAILRRAGFTGRLRAYGHVLADQYAMARRNGFDEVEIDDALAARQPQDQWLARADWTAHAYQSRLRG